MPLGRALEPTLLTAADGPPAEVVNTSGKGQFLLVCEHASNRIPAALGNLGLTPELLASHIAWDRGAVAVARALSELLDAPLVIPRFSRLVYDCNRPPGAPDAIVETSERYRIPGNAGLADSAREARIQEIYVPFRELLESIIRARPNAVMVTVHSFTPVYHGVARSVELGVLHDEDARLADTILPLAPAITGLRSQRNQPYGPEDGVTYTLRQHALPAKLLNVMLEIRNDRISDDASRKAVAASLAELLRAGLAAVRTPEENTKTEG
jgi:predicted N-formylglutamate amidohydrolase